MHIHARTGTQHSIFTRPYESSSLIKNHSPASSKPAACQGKLDDFCVLPSTS